ncbi:MAG: sulfatase-like hydrolase/transferase [Planctomycetes bacterium]|nr:sulfatase-like hydrolase/transferase [Planctomycetota bacterium]
MPLSSVIIALLLSFGAYVGGDGTNALANPPRQAADQIAASPQERQTAVTVPGNQPWTDAGLFVRAGEILAIEAEGRVRVQQRRLWEPPSAEWVGPEGSFLVADDVARQRFPLPAGKHGPAPCFCLIGRIGDGPPFVIGKSRSWKAERSGWLWLGINDFNPNDNDGAFTVRVSKPDAVRPIDWTITRSVAAGTGRPVPGAAVVVFYVDGLRPDVVLEMAALGHLPTIKRLFVDGGVWLRNAFTAFPSDTITSNGTMWTGCFSDRHGLKGQVRFSRRRLVSESYLDALGPSRSARLLSPQGMDRMLFNAQYYSRKYFVGEESAQAWQRRVTSGVPPLYAHLRTHGADWATSTLPLMTEVPPLLWTRSLIRTTPLLRVHESWQHMDEANVRYVLRHVLPRKTPVTVIWLPETDSVSHKRCRGQFGTARRTIARADQLIRQVVDELEAQGRLSNTYLMLVSDHGHHGGRHGHLSQYDLTNDFFYRPRTVDEEGRWIGGGLGLSVRQHRLWNRHPGDGPRQFVFIDGESDGAARIFLPKGWYGSGDWSGPNRPGDLLQYRIASHLPPVNLVQRLTDAVTITPDGEVVHPIDLVLLKVKVAENAILIATRDRGFAVIDRKKDPAGRWVYRYTPVTDVRPTSDGGVAWAVASTPATDPLGLLQRVSPTSLRRYYSERVWLEATADSRYPDAVVTLTRNLLWQPNLKAREVEYAPDLIVTARAGWYFGTEPSPGTMHGYPFPDSMRATWFIAGPGIPQGVRIDQPCRLVDLTPTILDMVGVPVDGKDFDGHPLRNIYSSGDDRRVVRVSLRPTYWPEYDLDAWDRLRYQPPPPSPLRPWTINHPTSPWDLHNIVYNALSLTELSVFRVIDDVLFPYLPAERRPVSDFVDRTDQHLRRRSPPWLADLLLAADVPDTTVGDYSVTSLGNLKRIDAAVDWLQERGLAIDRELAALTGQDRLPGSRTVHATLDRGQAAFWELYRFAQRMGVEIVDEWLLRGIEDQTDRAVNAWTTLPAEIPVPADAGPR